MAAVTHAGGSGARLFTNSWCLWEIEHRVVLRFTLLRLASLRRLLHCGVCLPGVWWVMRGILVHPSSSFFVAFCCSAWLFLVVMQECVMCYSFVALCSRVVVFCASWVVLQFPSSPSAVKWYFGGNERIYYVVQLPPSISAVESGCFHVFL